MISMLGKLKNKSKLFNSIKNKLIIYVAVIFILVFGIVALGNFNYSAFFKEYNTLYKKYNSLNQFYSNLNQSTECIKSYFYSHSKRDFKKYRSYIVSTADNLKYLKATASNDDVAWEYRMLSNMFDTYKETVNSVMTENRNNNEYSISGYNRIIRINELINSTNVKYFNVIIQEMNFSRNELYAKWLVQRNVTIVILMVLFILGSIFSVILLRSVTRPISQLVKNVKKFMVGDYDTPDIKGGGAEIETLAHAFNKMATGLRFYFREMQEKAQLQQQLLEQENENLRIHNLLRETELKALQGQMNPHFLFNTLSIINKMAYIEGAQKTSELLESTTELLRYNVYNSSKVSDVNSEIECIKNYLYIQQKRFGERIKFELFVGPELPNIKMPALIIQPMIENAVIHGVGDMVVGGMVKIIVKLEGNLLKISIEDNGPGIDSEIIENIMSVETPESKNGLGIGIINVKRRLEMFFGGRGLLIIESSPGCGTVVTINLPINECLEKADYV
jgi:two-component system, sensor histidine kinase YesM